MSTAVVAAAAFVASLLTLFSGFGLGTLLMPVVAVFFPIAVAVALTALVHLLNNLFKLATLWRWIDGATALRFGAPALLAALPGAWLLGVLAQAPPLLDYVVLGLEGTLTPVKLAVGVLLVSFAFVEGGGFAERLALGRRWLPAGGLLSGFFGGLSGHQGAFRSAFLLHAGLDTRGFVATNAAIAALVDVARLGVYGLDAEVLLAEVEPTLLLAATVAAFAGVLLGRLGVEKVTLAVVRRLVSVLLLLLGLGIGSGLL